MKEHKELGKICDEHSDDINALVNFYRDVGGIQHLVPNPNVPLSEVKKKKRKVVEHHRNEVSVLFLISCQFNQSSNIQGSHKSYYHQSSTFFTY